MKKRNELPKSMSGRKGVWKRDGNRCRCCGCAVVDDRTVPKFAGEVHHLNKDAIDNRMINKILLCKQCHSTLHKLSEEVYTKRIKEITGIETEVIADSKTFKMLDMAESGCSLVELKELTHYSTKTIIKLLTSVNISLGEQDIR
jgi:hypothetical protein